jgi:23S rRNA (uracil1939-C5)-methyltransferase
VRRQRRKSSRPPETLPETLDVEIRELGFLGDGVGEHRGDRLIVPLAMPGETWRVRRLGRAHAVEPVACLHPVAERREPVCPHFGTCGGCALQHLPEATYDALKIQRIEGALAAHRLAPPGPIRLHKSPLGSRRRLRLGFSGDGRFGFRRRAGREIVEVTTCPIARPNLEALIEPLRQMLRRLAVARNGGEATLTALDAGPEVVLHLPADPGLADREALAAFAEARHLVRLAISVGDATPEPLAARQAATLTIAGHQVALPPAAFLQATSEGEAALQAFTARHLAGARKVVDLFSGVGTLGLALVGHGATVRAFDASPELVAACRHPHLQATRRDLFNSPLQPDELRATDAAVLDPPRAGALAQVEALAMSTVPLLVYASCEPRTFARDAAVLVAAGYRLTALDAVDQFLFAPEVELAAGFVRVAT